MLDKSPKSRLYHPEVEEPRSNSDWLKLIGVDAKQYFMFFEKRETGNAEFWRWTKFYRIQGNFILGLPETPETAKAFWERLWKQRKHKGLTYFEGKPKIYARTFEQLSQFIQDKNLLAFATSLREKAGPDLSPIDPTWQGSRNFQNWYRPEEVNPYRADNTQARQYFQDFRHLVERFLEDIHGRREEPSIWRCIDRTQGRFHVNNENVPFSKAVPDIARCCEDKYEAYFNICPSKFIPEDPFGGAARWVRERPRSLWMDFDRGLAGGIEKQEMLAGVNSLCAELEIPCTHKVETRNGYHLYWVMKAPIDEGAWKRCQLRLIAIFKHLGADPRITSLGLCPRLPFTNHWKDQNEPFRLGLTFEDVSRYDLAQFMDKAEVPTEEKEAVSILRKDFAFTPKYSLRRNQQLTTLDLAGKSIDEYASQVLKTMMKAKRSLPLLCSYLGVPVGRHKSMRCVFHQPDNHPSAGIFESRGGNWVYECFKCDMQGDILTLLEEKKSRKQALEKLFRLSGREDLIDFKPQLDLTYLDYNLKILKESEIFAPSYNHPVKGWIFSFFEEVFGVAMKKILSYDGRFPASLKELAGSRSVTNFSNKVYLMRLAGLIQIAMMPEVNSLQVSQDAFQDKKRYLNPTSWHLIPKWTPEILEEGFKLLETAYANGITTNSCTREGVREVFGEEFEKRVFHGRSNTKRRPKNREEK